MEPFSDYVVDIVEKEIGRYRPIRQGIVELTETLIKFSELSKKLWEVDCITPVRHGLIFFSLH